MNGNIPATFLKKEKVVQNKAKYLQNKLNLPSFYMTKGLKINKKLRFPEIFHLSQSKVFENPTLHSGTYLYRLFMGVPPPPPPPGISHQDNQIRT